MIPGEFERNSDLVGRLMDATARVECQYTRDASFVDVKLRNVASTIRSRIGFGRLSDSPWSSRFSPLVLTYPRLQSESFGPIPNDVLDRATLAHLYFLIFSVLDDRRRDGQVSMSPEEVEYSAWIFRRGLDLLGEIVDEKELEWLANTVQQRYEESHCKLDASAWDPARGFRDEAKHVVVGRSYWGLLSTLAITHRFSEVPDTIAQVIEAFEVLVWGIQWADDIEDWRDDLRTGDDNLLLLSLGAALTDAHECARQISDQRAIQKGCEEVRASFAHAARIQEKLGCETLAALIVDRSHNLIAVEHDAIGECSRDILAQEILSGRSA